jgi:DNA-binding NtrC family response regulator
MSATPDGDSSKEHTVAENLRILIVDDEPNNLALLEQDFEDLGYETISATSGEEALAAIDGFSSAYEFPGIVVTDIKMPEMDGLALMSRLREFDRDLPIILITAHGDIQMAVQAMHDGAYDFIEKPIEPKRLSETVRRALEKRSLVLDNRALQAELAIMSGLDARIIGNSTVMAELRENIANIAGTNASVLIHGETGTGKELVARCLHDIGLHSRNHFVPVNCGGIPETMFESELFGHEAGAFTDAKKRRIGKLEYADGGTLFLDEIESMRLNMQVKLLRVLQERVIERLGSNDQIPVDFRVVAATKADLKDATARGEFREDFYFRLAVAEIRIPPLRERLEDIPLLFESLSRQRAAYHEREAPELSRDALGVLMAHSWPGNIRELQNVVERYVLGLGGPQQDMAALLAAPTAGIYCLSDKVSVFEKTVIEQALAENSGNIQDTADALSLPRRTLNEKMRKYGLERSDFV